MKNLYELIDKPYNHGAATVLVVFFCLIQLSGCSVISESGDGKHHKASSFFASSSYDGPPSKNFDASRIPDAVPKPEPFHKYGTKDYKVAGRHYRVLKSNKGYVKTGYASWYGSKFHGGQTSTQERFNLYAMTAASPHLPIPSYAQVTNMKNGRSVVVRVNDRGPFHGDRILDLSYAAAKKLGFADMGVAPVKVTAIDPTTWKKSYAPSSSNGITIAKTESLMSKAPLFLQVGAFSELENAKRISKKVNQLVAKHQVNIKHKSDLYRVQIGPIASIGQGEKLKQLLEKNGLEHVTVVR